MTRRTPVPILRGRVERVAVLAMLIAVTLAGCGLGDPTRQADMSITNDTAEPLAISIETGPPRYTTQPGWTVGFSLSGREGDCTQWVLSATTADGVVAARTGPPVCSGDHWTITQAELDKARQDAGVPTPSPAPSASPSPVLS
jgi:hypothetical protein